MLCSKKYNWYKEQGLQRLQQVRQNLQIVYLPKRRQRIAYQSADKLLKENLIGKNWMQRETYFRHNLLFHISFCPMRTINLLTLFMIVLICCVSTKTSDCNLFIPQINIPWKYEWSLFMFARNYSYFLQTSKLWGLDLVW